MKNKAFTLIELLVVIVIIGVLASISTATYRGYIGKANDAKTLAEEQEAARKIIRQCVEEGRTDCATAEASCELDVQSWSTCPTTAAGYSEGQVLECTCPNGSTAIGNVWGTSTYTNDSAICRSAVHNGSIRHDLDSVSLTLSSGESSYTGSTQNAITTNSYGSYPQSYQFNTLPTSCIRSTHCHQICPNSINSLLLNTGDTYSCICDSIPNGTIWGTNIYTYDSALCSSAVHSGVISGSGEAISLQMMGSQSSYIGSTQNSITTNSYGTYPQSYQFTGSPDTSNPLCQ